MRTLLIAAAVLLSSLVGNRSAALERSSPALSAKAIADFTLSDHLGAKHSLSDWSDKQAIVVVFLGTECPLAKLYGGRLAELQEKYADRGVQVVGINSNRQDTLREIARYVNKHGVSFPMLKDPGGKIAQEFGAKRTPEAFLLDSTGAIQYRGRIDDQYGVGTARSEPRHSELAAALDALLAGDTIEVPSTEAVGCLISFPREASAASDVTYANQISRLLQKNCVNCHREGQIAPFALASYDEASAWAETMLEVIEDNRMPPWHANPKHGEFLNEARLTDREKETFRQWVADGAPEGDPAKLPAATEYAQGWQIPKPDAVYEMPKAFDVPAEGIVDYQYFYLDREIEEDIWVRGAEVRPGNPEVVHHIILFSVPSDRKRYRPEDALFNLVAAFAPGTPPMEAPPGQALRIPAGSRLIFQVHYTPNGSPQTDLSKVGLLYAKPEEVQKELLMQAGLNARFQIPPHHPDYVVKTDYLVREDALVHTLTPHMHYRGKSFRFTAKYPNGDQEILLDVPHYDFNWQNIYVLKEPKRLPKGSEIEMVAHFDNSSNNPFNPDPEARVTWGDQTWQEMMLGTMTFSRADQNMQATGPTVEPLSNGNSRVTFRYMPSTPVESVQLSGDFNGWEPEGLPMKGPNARGEYTVVKEFAPGEHEYKFVLNGEEWKTDPGNNKTSGSWKNSVLELK